MYKLNSRGYKLDYDYINSNYKNMLETILDDFNCSEIEQLINDIGYSYKQSNCFSDFKNKIRYIVERNNYDIDLSKI